MKDTIKWGILAPGNIAHSFAKDLKLIKDAKLVAVASRNKQRAEVFAKEYGVLNFYGSYEELFEDENVDVIYIATPHTGHAKWAIKAMKKGKHVLCEKPLGTSLLEVEEMLKVAKEEEVFLMEALWSRFNPSILAVINHIEKGDIGNLNYLHADFAFYALNRDVEGRLLNPNLGGGSLLDIGIYPIFLSYLLLGKPKNIQAAAKFHANGAEIQTSMLFDFNDAQAILYSGLNSKSEMKAEISGSEGSIFIDPRWHEAQGYSIVIDNETTHFSLPTNGAGYTYEVEEVHECLRKGKLESTKWSHQNSIDLISLLDEVRQIAGITFPFEG